MNYMEGMSGPIHFSQYAGREVAMGAARKWSLDDIAGSVAVRCERQLPAERLAVRGAPAVPGADRILFARWHGADDRDRRLQRQWSGIACQYETTSTQDLMDVSTLGGVTINALGEGSMTVSVMVARTYEDSQQSPASNGTDEDQAGALSPDPGKLERLRRRRERAE